MSGGWGILAGQGMRQYARRTAGNIEDLQDYVHNLASKSLQMDSSGNVDVSGVINIATAGGIFQGTGTFASPTTGLKIYSDGTNGTIELWDASAKAFALTHTKLLFGSNVAAAATTALAVFAEDATYNSESLGAGDLLLGDNSAGKANLLWDKSDGSLVLRSGTTKKIKLEADGDMFIGSDISAVATTYLCVFSNDQTYNTESLGVGDLLLGDNSANKANLLWDKSAGKLQFRGGQTMQCEIGTDGKFYAGAGVVSLDATGVKVQTGTVYADVKSYNFTETDGTIIAQIQASYDTNAPAYRNLNITTVPDTSTAGQIHIVAQAPSGQTCRVNLQSNVGAGVDAFLSVREGGDVVIGSGIDGTGAADLTVQGGLNVGSATGAGTGQIIVDQGTGDGEILTLRSTGDVAHGMTALTDTATYASFTKTTAASGSLNLHGFSELTYALSLVGYATGTDDTKATTSAGSIVLAGAAKSGTGAGGLAGNGNILVIRDYLTTRFIFDIEGSAHADVEFVAFDDYDDLGLLNKLDAAMTRDPIKTEFGRFLSEYQRELQDAGIVDFYDPDSKRAMLNTTRLSMLLVGALRQTGERINRMQGEIVALQQRLLLGDTGPVAEL